MSLFGGAPPLFIEHRPNLVYHMQHIRSNCGQRYSGQGQTSQETRPHTFKLGYVVTAIVGAV